MSEFIPLSGIAILRDSDGILSYDPESEMLLDRSGGQQISRDEVIPLGGRWCLLPTAAVGGGPHPWVLVRYLG